MSGKAPLTDAVLVDIGLVRVGNLGAIVQVILYTVEIEIVARIASISNTIGVGVILKKVALGNFSDHGGNAMIIRHQKWAV